MPTQRPPIINALPGLVRAFREWAGEVDVSAAPEVSGASENERALLAALGGIAAGVAGERVHQWPEALANWATAAPQPPEWLIEAVCVELGRRVDALAALYNCCVSARNRRRLGTVFTPDPIVSHMLSMVDEVGADPPGKVVDPGAGVGAFTIAAARHWQKTSIVAVDVNPVTLGLLAARIAFEIDADPAEADSLSRIRLVHEDYIGALDDLFEVDADGPVVALGNPPYTRIQELPRADRERTNRETMGVIDSGHANLAVLFQAATLARMRPQDASCMILPGSFAYTRAGRGLRQSLWNSRRRVDVHRWPATERAFTGRAVQAAILAIGPIRDKQPPLRLASVEIAGEAVKASESRRLSRQTAEPKSWFEAERTAPPAKGTTPLSRVAKVKRGVATGANEMFFVDDATAAELPDEVIVPGMPTLRGFEAECLDKAAHAAWGGPAARRWLLSISPDQPLTGRLAEYVEDFAEVVEARHLPSSRPVWYSVAPRPTPALLISPLSRSRFKVVANTVGAVPSNNLFGISPNDPEEVARIASWLRSEDGQRELLRASHRYPGGSHKLEPSDLAGVRLTR